MEQASNDIWSVLVERGLASEVGPDKLRSLKSDAKIHTKCDAQNRADKIREMVPEYMRLWAPLDAVRVLVQEREIERLKADYDTAITYGVRCEEREEAAKAECERLREALGQCEMYIRMRDAAYAETYMDEGPLELFNSKMRKVVHAALHPATSSESAQS